MAELPVEGRVAKCIRTHLVGSLPFVDARDAMKESLERLGATLPHVPDGETGERKDFILHLGNRMVQNPQLKARRTMLRFFGMHESVYRFIVRPEGNLEFPLGQLGYHSDWVAGLDLFRELREKCGRPELRYQMSVATPLSIAGIYFRTPRNIRRALGPMREGLRAEIAAAVETDRKSLVIQLDAPGEQAFVAITQRFAPPFARAVARRMARQLAVLATDVPHDVPLGIHLCLGNANNRRGITPRTARPVVLLANECAAAFAGVRPLDFLHIPLVNTSNPRHFAPLADLRLAKSTRLIAGLVYEDGHGANRDRLRLAAEALGFIPDVACACGMGRRTPDVARLLLDELHSLANSSEPEAAA